MNNMEEIWKPISDFEGYEVSNFGNFRSIDRIILNRLYKGKNLIPKNNKKCKNSYTINLKRKGKELRIAPWNIVAGEFIVNEFNYKYVIHLDGNPTNNKVENLKWSLTRVGTLSYEKILEDFYFKNLKIEEINQKYSITKKTVYEILCGHGAYKNIDYSNYLSARNKYLLGNNGDEQWADIQDLKNIYKVSTLGRIVELARIIEENNEKKIFLGLELKKIKSCKYFTVVIYLNKERKTKLIHRLVAETFLSNPNKFPIVNHKNGVKTDNRVENLEWCTHKQNSIHAVEFGLTKRTVYSKISDKQAVEIRDIYKNNPYATFKEIGKMFNVSGEIIAKIIKDKYKHYRPNDKVAVYGSTGFIGNRFCSMYPYLCNKQPRDLNPPVEKNILYFISTTTNYNIFDSLQIDIDTNLNKLMSVLEHCKNNDIIFNFVSSWFVYGENELPVKEDFQKKAKGFYSITKSTAEDMLMCYCEIFNIKYRIFRLANVFGPNDKDYGKEKNALQYLMKKIKNNKNIELYYGGNFIRDYIFVDSVCEAMKLLMFYSPVNEIYNIGSGKPTKFIDIMNFCKNETNSGSEFISIIPPNFHSICQVKDMFLDISKLEKLGFKPSHNLWDGLRQTLKFL